MPYFANLDKVISPIESRDKDERRKILLDRILDISLAYANKKFLAEKSIHPDYSFSDAIKSFSPVKNIILQPIFNLDGFNWQEKKDEMEKFLTGAFKELDEAYERFGFSAAEIKALISSKAHSIKNDLGLADWPSSENTARKEAKIFSFNDIQNLEYDAEGKYAELADLGFSKLDQLVEIHVGDFYASSEPSLGRELIEHDLALIAEYVLDKKPQVAAIVGQSWLLDTPLADRLGFTRITGDLPAQNDFSTWLQFIDRSGQIDKKRFEEFMWSGELPHKSVKGYIKTEDFLRKYLPEDRRGDLVLLEIDPFKEKEWQEMQAQGETLKSAWDNSLSSGSFDGFMAHAEVLVNLLDSLTVPDRDDYLDFLHRMYEQQIPFSDFNKYKDAAIEALDEKIKQARFKLLYRERRLRI